MARRGVVRHGVVWCGLAACVSSPARQGGEVNVDGKKRVQNLSLHSQRENRTDQNEDKGKHQLFSTITRVQGVGHIPDMLELWVENVPALQRSFYTAPLLPSDQSPR